MSIIDIIFWSIVFSPSVFLVLVMIGAIIFVSDSKEGGNIYVKKEKEQEKQSED